MSSSEAGEPTIIDRIESSDTPMEAVAAVGELSVRRVLAVPLKVGREILKIVMNGDVGETLSAAANHQ